MKVALVYDRVNKFGGAERVLQVLAEIYLDAPLYSAVYNKETAHWADDFTLQTTFLQHIPYAKTNHEYIAPLASLAFEGLDFSEFDLVISVTSEYAKGIITKPNTLHICYCLTPTRYLWSGYEQYFTNDIAKIVSKPMVAYLKNWDIVAAARPDFYIAISKTVAARIKKYYGRESVVIYPPVTLEVAKVSKVPKVSNGSYFLIVSRLVPYKRIDIAIEACNRLGWELKIVGTGREYDRLKSLAGPTIEFLQNLTDGQLIGYYQDCAALIFPAEEDFGLAILEAQRFGKPVIAFRGGGALETVVEGKTGMLFSPQTAAALIGALRKFKPSAFNPKDSIANTKKFGKERFKKEFKSTVDRLYEEYRKN